MARYIKIDNTIVNPNAGFKIALEDISSSDSGRNLSATMDKTVIAQKWTVNLSWSFISDEAISRILKASKTNTYVQLTFPNPYLGKDDTRTFYSGTPSITHKVLIGDVNFWDLELNFIEQ